MPETLSKSGEGTAALDKALDVLDAIGESTYSTSSAVPTLSHSGAAGWRSANHSRIASPRNTRQSSTARLNTTVSWRVIHAR